METTISMFPFDPSDGQATRPDPAPGRQALPEFSVRAVAICWLEKMDDLWIIYG